MNRIKEFFKNMKFPHAAGLFRSINLAAFPGRLKRISIGRWILVAFTILLVAAAFITTRSLMRCWDITNLPGISPSDCPTNSNAGVDSPVINIDENGTPIALPPTPVVAPELELPSWDGASRVNILFIGLDYRDYIANEGPPRSDSMILFTIDPLSKTAGMLSIPRDMWVNIPGFGYSRINTAYSSGEGSKLPGGGPGLAVKTVEQFLGVPIQYYGQIDFGAFEEAIDAMGGLYLCVPEKIRIDPIGNKKPENLKPGCQTLYGYQVLGYARNRHTANGDIDRANRQQQVVYALRDQIFNPANFPTMVSKAPQVYAEASGGLRTNLTFEDLMKLGVLMQQIPRENIKSGIIDYSMGVMDNVVLGGQNASILKPIPDKIRVLRDEIFTSAGAASPMAAGDLLVLMQQDGARVRVLNGSIQPDLAQRTANYLLTQQVPVTEVGTTQSGIQNTVIVIYGPKLYTMKYLMSVFGISTSNQIIFASEPATTADIEVRLGNDWLNRLPAGY